MTSWIIDLLLGVARGAGLLPKKQKAKPLVRWNAPVPSTRPNAKGYVPEWAEPLD